MARPVFPLGPHTHPREVGRGDQPCHRCECLGIPRDEAPGPARFAD